jgi:hypothetical protein
MSDSESNSEKRGQTSRNLKGDSGARKSDGGGGATAALLAAIAAPVEGIGRKAMHKRHSSNLKDNHLLLLCELLEVRLPEEAHLLALITEFLLYKEARDGFACWRYRVTREGTVYWLDAKHLQTARDFPYLAEL